MAKKSAEANPRPIMERRRETSPSTRRAIVELFLANNTKKQIASQLNIHKTTVYRWLERYTQGRELRNELRPGRPRCTTEEEDNHIFDFVWNRPITSTTEVKQETNIQVSKNTIRRRLQERGLQCKNPATKPFLTQAHKEDRIGFSLQYLPMEKEFWENVIWCDEKTFSNDEHGRLKCWRPPKSR